MKEAIASCVPVSRRREIPFTNTRYVMNQKSKFLNTCSQVIHSFHRYWVFGKHNLLVQISAAAPWTSLGNHKALSSAASVRLLIPDAFACVSPLIPGYTLLLSLRLADVSYIIHTLIFHERTDFIILSGTILVALQEISLDNSQFLHIFKLYVNAMGPFL